MNWLLESTCSRLHALGVYFGNPCQWTVMANTFL